MARRTAVAVGAAVAVLAGCGGSTPVQVALPSPSPSSTAAPVSTPRPPPRPSPTPRRRPATHPPAVIAAPPHHVRRAAPKPSPLLVTRLHGVGEAGQVISVVASGYGTSSATLQAFEKNGSTWRRVFGPWSAHVGRDGFAPPGDKREGDLRTPSGSYGFQYMFGVKSNPGVHFDWRPVRGSYDVWDDDPSSGRYNLWTDTRTQDAGHSPESMHQLPAYNYGAVIAYNTSRTPGLGSAIFFHVSTGGGTAGCVSLPTGELLDVLRWMNPSKGPRIIMGTESSVT